MKVYLPFFIIKHESFNPFHIDLVIFRIIRVLLRKCNRQPAWEGEEDLICIGEDFA